MENFEKSQAGAGADHVGGQLDVVSRQIAELTLDPRNPRRQCRPQIRQIARSMHAFGFCVPVHIDRPRRVLAGHGRILACQELGWREVPTLSLAHLTDTQARAFMIADNRLTEHSQWDERLLGEQVKGLAEGHLECSLDATGFELGEIDLLIDSVERGVFETRHSPHSNAKRSHQSGVSAFSASQKL